MLQNATGTVLATLGSSTLILAKTTIGGRAVHFGTLDYLRADRFGFTMGLDDLFWRSLVWAARKPFVLRGYPRFWSVQMDDTNAGWPSRVRDLYDTTLTGQINSNGIGGPWKVTGYVFTDNLPAGSTDRANVITDINAGKIEVSPHSFGNVNGGNLFWNASSGALSDSQWLANLTALDTWKQGNGSSDVIPFYSRSMVAHFWNLSNNTGSDMWNHLGFRYVTSIQKAGFQSTAQNNGAERLPVRSFWPYEMPPKTVIDPSFSTENFPFFFSDDYTVGSRQGLQPQNFFLFGTQYLDFSKYSRVDFAWPGASATPTPTVASSLAQLQQYTWRHWSGLDPVQIFTHDSLNFEGSTAANRQSVVSQASTWLNSNGVRHVFMDDLGDYIRARSKSRLTRATFDQTQLAYTFTGSATTADGAAIPTQVLVFQGDVEGVWQTIPGFGSGLQISLNTPSPTAPALTTISPTLGQQGQTLNVTLTGSGFQTGATCSFTLGVVVNTCTVNSATQIVANITVSNTAGNANVTVTNPDGQSTVLAGGFTILGPGVQHLDFNYANRTSLLNAGWSFIATTAAGGTRNTEQSGGLAVDYNQSTHPGSLRVPLGVGEDWQNSNNSQNTLFFTPPSDWTSLRVKLAAFNPIANYQQVGIHAYQNEDNYISLDRIFGNVSQIEMFREIGQTTTSVAASSITNTGNIILRLDRSGNTYAGYYSIDNGANWVSVGSTTATLTNPKLAIMSGANLGSAISVDIAWAETIHPLSNPAPVVTSVSPASGTQGQSLPVTITGSNFLTGATCSFGAGTTSSCTYNSSTQLTAALTITGSAATGVRTVSVTNTDSQVGNLNNGFTVNAAPAPTLTSASPNSGQQSQTLNVVLAGTNFLNGATCSFGAGITVNSCTFNSATQLTANLTVAALATVGTRTVTVTNPNALSASLTSGFTVVAAPPPPAPTLTSISPNSGQQTQTLNITLTGSNFVSGATCSFGAGITVNSCTVNTSLQATASITIAGSATIGTRSVTFTNPDLQTATLANSFTVNTQPAGLTHLDFTYPDRTSLLNAGWSFIATTAANGARNTEGSGASAPDYSQTSHAGSIRIPLGAGENWQNINNSQNTLFYTPASDWTSFRVKLAAFNPTANYQQVGLQAYQDDDNYVDVNRAFVTNSHMEMFREIGQATAYTSTVIPITNTGNLILRLDRSGTTYTGFYSTDNGATWASLGSVTVNLTNPRLAIMSGASTAGTPTADIAWAEILRPAPASPPTVSSAAPNAATQSQVLNVTLTGANFQSGATCSFGSGITVNSCTFNSATQLTANLTISGSATVGTRTVTVTNPDAQSGSLTNGFTVNTYVPLPAPTLSSATPNSGQQSQTLGVTLAGSNFQNGATCSFGTGVTVNSCTFNSATQLTANITIAAAATVGTRNVTVTNPDGQSALLAGGFTVNVSASLVHLDFTYANRTAMLAAGWSFIATPAGGGTRDTEQTASLAVDYNQSTHPGVVRVPLGAGENWQNANNSQNTLFYTPAADWTSFRVKISAFNPTANYQQVGLHAYQDDDNYVSVDRAFVASSRIEMFREVAQATSYMSTAALSNTGNLILRVDRSGNVYSGFYSTDGGTTWIATGSTTVTLTNPKLAIMIGSNDGSATTADIAWAEILRP
ncbi:MAG TPA: IPT/TIG domain-containing protein [Terriglobales bacterium]|nr:IPT/TIG domain-containing protein [Terriglobales bacterium]